MGHSLPTSNKAVQQIWRYLRIGVGWIQRKEYWKHADTRYEHIVHFCLPQVGHFSRCMLVNLLSIKMTFIVHYRWVEISENHERANEEHHCLGTHIVSEQMPNIRIFNKWILQAEHKKCETWSVVIDISKPFHRGCPLAIYKSSSYMLSLDEYLAKYDCS